LLVVLVLVLALRRILILGVRLLEV